MDWVVGFTTIISVELMIRRKWYAWLAGLLNQGVWLTFIITEDQWGLLPLNCLLVVQNTRGLIAWLRNPIGVQHNVETDHVPNEADPPGSESPGEVD